MHLLNNTISMLTRTLTQTHYCNAMHGCIEHKYIQYAVLYVSFMLKIVLHAHIDTHSRPSLHFSYLKSFE